MNIQDFWRELKADTRKFCKGWGANINIQKKKEKRLLLDKLKVMDKREETRGLDTSQWQERYRVEKQLEDIYHYEELQWQRRGGGVKWKLKGDANSTYFHSMAGRRNVQYFHWKRRSEKCVTLQKSEVM
jgi:hypothetical protein